MTIDAGNDDVDAEVDVAVESDGVSAHDDERNR
jgi:hypothetical protein